MPPPSASVSGQAQLPVAAQVPGAPFWPPPRMAWCELCRVDCNTLEIQESHKNFASTQGVAETQHSHNWTAECANAQFWIETRNCSAGKS